MIKRSKRYNQTVVELTNSSVPLIYLNSFGFWNTTYSSDNTDLGFERDALAAAFADNLNEDLCDEE